MVTDLCDMMVERLNAFKAKSNALPKRVLVYRDGVSEVCHFHLFFYAFVCCGTHEK
jgi:hypothetical protein